MKLAPLLLLLLVASAAAAPQMIIGQSVMEAFRAAIEAEAAEAAPVQTAPAEAQLPAPGPPASQQLASEAPASEAPASEATASEAPASEAPPVEVPSVEVPVEEAPAVEVPAAEAPVEEAPAVEVPVTTALPRHLRPIVAIILPSDSELSAATPELEKETPVPAPPTTAAPASAAAPVPAPAASAPQVSPTAELEQAAAVSAAQVEQSIVPESTATDGGSAPAASGRSLDSPAASAAAGVAPTVVPILLDEREPIVGNAFGFRFRSADGQFRSEKSSLKPLPPGAVASPNALPEYETVGEYSFTHPDGTLHRVTYTAGLNGYVATGDMLPTPPPMPVWALEQIQFAEEQKRLQAAAAAVESAAPAPDVPNTLSNAAAAQPSARAEQAQVQAQANVDEPTAAILEAAAASDTATVSDAAVGSGASPSTV